MSEAKGMLKTCDRCGETVFLKAISDGVTDPIGDYRYSVVRRGFL